MRPLTVNAYSRFILITFLVVSVLFWALALHLDPVVGDLTRIGRWSENDFGWNAPQPVIDIAENGRAITRPDIVVLGDSFSVSNYWQSALSLKTGKKILTYWYDDVGCIENWIAWAREHPVADLVIVQVVERNFVDWFRNVAPCRAGAPLPAEVPSGRTASHRPTWPPTLDIKYLFLTALNSIHMTLRPHAAITHGDVVNIPIRPGCASFSHRRSTRLLHYIHDLRGMRWTDEDIGEAVGNVRRFKETVTRAGKKFLFVVIPNKLSVYQKCLDDRSHIRFPDLTRRLREAGIETPDLQNVFAGNVDRIVDLYYPDNTHWSTRGYQLAAETIAPHVLR